MRLSPASTYFVIALQSPSVTCCLCCFCIRQPECKRGASLYESPQVSAVHHWIVSCQSVSHVLCIHTIPEKLLVCCQMAEAALADEWVINGDRIALQRRVLRLGKPPRRWKRPSWAAVALREPLEVRSLLCNHQSQDSRLVSFDIHLQHVPARYHCKASGINKLNVLHRAFVECGNMNLDWLTMQVAS